MSDRVSLHYDDGSKIDFNSVEDAVYHLYGPEGARGVRELRAEPDVERNSRIHAARTALEAAGVNAKLPDLEEGDVILAGDQLHEIVGTLRDDEAVPVLRQSRNADGDVRDSVDDDSKAALKAIRKLVKEAK